MTAFFQDVVDATLIDTKRLSDVVLALTKEVPFPHLYRVVKSQRWTRAAK